MVSREADTSYHADMQLSLTSALQGGCDPKPHLPQHRLVQAHAVPVQPHYAVSLMKLQLSRAVHLHLS